METTNNFLKAIDFTLPWEVGRDRSGQLRQDGGYTNDPQDPGGETKWGISKRANPDLDIANLSLGDAIMRYKIKYWDVFKTFKTAPLDLDKADMAYAVAVFDTGVNCGVNRTHEWHKVAVKSKDPVRTLLGLRDFHYTNLKAGNPSLGKYYKGWINRLNDLKKNCEILQIEASDRA